MKLKNKIALITGASTGIGKAVAKNYIREGAKVIAVARNIKKLEELDDYAKIYGNSIVIAPIDLRETTKIELLAKFISEKFSKIDILVGNAGIVNHLSPLTHIEDVDWHNIINVNLTANFKLIKSFEPLLSRSDHARIIMVSSDITDRATAYWGASSISKKALEHMVEIYAKENSKININIIRPNMVKTDMLKQVMPGLANSVKLPWPDDITEIFVKLASSNSIDTGRIFSTN